VAGVQKTGGAYQVRIGRSYMVRAYVISAKAPHYVLAAPRGVEPHPTGPAMTKIGPDLWAIQVNVTTLMRHYKFWTLGVLVNGTLHTLSIELNS
jgi:hypothetical protein